MKSYRALVARSTTFALVAALLTACDPSAPDGGGGAGGSGGATASSGGAGGGTDVSSGGACEVQSMTATFVGLGDPMNMPGPTGADVMDGHKLSHGFGYNIYGNSQFNGDPKDGNCHNAARRGEHGGVVICQGDPTRSNPNYVDMSQYHTFQYEVVDGPPDHDAPGTVFYNWSSSYFVMKTPDPGAAPDMQDGSLDQADRSFLAAGKLFCGTQWTPDTRAVPGDGDIEDPTPAVCAGWVKQHAPDHCNPLGQCIRCCDNRSDHWKNNGGLATADDFDQKCVSYCCLSAGFPGEDPRCPI